MTTTDEFQINPNYFLNINDCKNKISYNTNSRYSNFKQTHFTVGDEEQFEIFRNYENISFTEKDICLKDNVYKKFTYENIFWNKYQNLSLDDMFNTFKYIFNKFKKGIYIKILNNELKCFLPFSKINFVNEWDQFIKYDKTRWKSMIEFIKYCASLQGIKIDDKKINKFVNTWYANNFLLRPEYPTGEGDSGVSNIKDMLIELCKNRKVPDIELFINRRDTPILKKDGTEPYESLFNSTNYPLISHNYDKYFPILSMVTADNYADIPIPTIEDWARVSSIEDKKYFVPPRDFNYKFETSFKDKIPKAVFRGASTGEGTTPETNPRLQLILLSKKFPELIDAGITKWNTRPRKEFGKEFLTTIDYNKYNLSLSNFLTPEEQSKYKYIINVDGHVSAYRLSLELNYGSVILLSDSKYRLWFKNLLKPFKHYVPIKKDLSDLIEKINWCNQNQKECEEIIKNCKKFYKKYLSKNSMLDYLQNLFIKISKSSGLYFDRILSVNSICLREQLKFLNTLEHKNEYDNIIYTSEIKSDKTIIKEFNIHNIKYLEKKSLNKNEIVNEAFIGLNMVNEMLKYIPNFKKITYYKNDSLYSEKIDGILFSEWIKKSFNIYEYLWIILQLSLILQFSQNFCLFGHKDLYPWNIIIKKTQTPIEINYPIFNTGVYKIKTNIYPILIDFGKSRIMKDDIYYGLNNIFNFNTFQDCLIILLSSIYNIFSLDLENNQINTIFKLSKIFIETDSLTTLKTFVRTKKKYNEIIYNNDLLYKDKSPIDLYNHILSFTKFKNNNWKISILNKYEIPYILKCKDEDLIQSIIKSEKNTIEDMYYLSLMKKFQKIDVKNWNGIIMVEKEHIYNLYDNILYNENKFNHLLNEIYQGDKTSKFYYYLFNLIYIDNTFDKSFFSTYKKKVLENINYLNIVKYISDSKSIKFYGKEIIENKLSLCLSSSSTSSSPTSSSTTSSSTTSSTTSTSSSTGTMS